MKKLGYLAMLLLISGTTIAQQYTIDKAKSAMSIKGTSTLHDWESVVESFTGTAVLKGDKIESVKWVAQVKSIKSGKDAMDKNTYNAMKASKYPEITVSGQNLNWENNRLKGNISLSIAGVTKQVPLNLSMVKGTTLEVKGEVPIKMTTFGIEPPTAVLGTIKTGDDITIVFDLILTK